MRRFAVAGFAAALLLAGADQPRAPVAANPVVNLRGRIARVDAVRPGQGMPSIVVETEGASTTVLLGSMRYLMEHDFNPKSGAPVEVKGYKLSSSVVAIEVRLPAEKSTLRLRDDYGWPLWRGGGCPHCGGSPRWWRRRPRPWPRCSMGRCWTRSRTAIRSSRAAACSAHGRRPARMSTAPCRPSATVVVGKPGTAREHGPQQADPPDRPSAVSGPAGGRLAGGGPRHGDRPRA